MRLNHIEAGEGPPVVFSHGLFGAARNFGFLQRALAPSFRVIALDARNHGASPHAAGMRYADLAADVLVTPRHGSKSALAPGFYQKVGARWAFTSCARGNGYGYPSPDVTNALRQAGATALSTAYGGAVTATWDSPEGPPTVASRG